MNKKIDLTGKSFGKLNVICESGSHITKGGYKLRSWLCQCDCGNFVSVPQQSLKNGNTRSCGCLCGDDLTGKKFGNLTVVKLSDNRKHGKQKIWNCKCICGNKVDVPTGRLKSGHTKSCGCSRAIDITGQRFGRLTVIKKTERRDESGNVYWYCKCDCGGNIETQGKSLRKGLVISCGCAKREHGKNLNLKHGMSRTRVYDIWCAMKSRCSNNSDENYLKYGGRGISICEEWIDSEDGFENFAKWAFDNGYMDDLSIDRIDVDGDYKPSNCKWSTPKEQMQNTRRNRYVKHDGKIYSISELAEKLNMTYMQTWHRFRDISFGMEDLSEGERKERGRK